MLELTFDTTMISKLNTCALGPSVILACLNVSAELSLSTSSKF